ncbi:hypothetical protein [Haliangium sp.]|uniref:hypothetical protein n=1 Tax=Haliangium sp. TaxID=2663208 RepID=UPI003D0EAD42
MDLVTPPPSAAPVGLRAMAMVARAAQGGLVDTHRVLLDTAQRLLLRTELDIDMLSEVDAATLAQHFDDPALARQLIRGMIVMSLAVGPAAPAQIELIGRFAAELGVDEPAIRAIEHLARKEMVRFVLDLHRRSNLRDYIDNQYRNQGGVFGVIKGLLEFKGVIHDDALAARFKTLAELPDDTLGRCLFDHYDGNGFSFPGEAGGFPVGAVFHDVGHVLAGYDTSPEGELQIASFQAGYRRTEHAFFTVLFAVLVHTAGVNVAPFPMPKHPGRIGEGDLAARMLHALQRGSQMTVDLGDDWDFWQYAEVPLAQARQRLGVPPLGAEYRSGVGIYGPPIGRW